MVISKIFRVKDKKKLNVIIVISCLITDNVKLADYDKLDN